MRDTITLVVVAVCATAAAIAGVFPGEALSAVLTGVVGVVAHRRVTRELVSTDDSGPGR